MSHVVIDTNVLMVANEDAPPEQADEACQIACIERLQAIQSGESKETVVVDFGNRLIDEYQKTLKCGQQPSTGHGFLSWIYQVIGNPGHCDNSVEITCTNEDEQVFEEFPAHEALKNFDVSDRKFIATANAHAAKPPVLQAVDAKWMGWAEALSECGIEIEFLCPNLADRLYQEHLNGSR